MQTLDPIPSSEQAVIMRRLQDSIILKQFDSLSRCTQKIKFRVYFDLKFFHLKHEALRTKYSGFLEESQTILDRVRTRMAFRALALYQNEAKTGLSILHTLSARLRRRRRGGAWWVLLLHAFCKSRQVKFLESIRIIVDEILSKKQFLENNSRKYKRELYYYHFVFQRNFEIKARCFEVIKSLRNRANLHSKVLLKLKNERLEQKLKRLRRNISKLESKIKSSYNSIYNSIGCKAPHGQSSQGSREKRQFNLYDKKAKTRTVGRKQKLSLNALVLNKDLNASRDPPRSSPMTGLKNISVDGLNKIAKNIKFFPKHKGAPAQPPQPRQVESVDQRAVAERRDLERRTKNFIYKRSFTELYKTQDKQDFDQHVIKSPIGQSHDFECKSGKHSAGLDSPYFSKKAIATNGAKTGSLKKMANVANSLADEERRIYSTGLDQDALQDHADSRLPVAPRRAKWCSLKNSIRDIGMKGIYDAKGFPLQARGSDKEKDTHEQSARRDSENLEITLGRRVPAKPADAERDHPGESAESRQEGDTAEMDLLKLSTGANKINPFINTNESNERPRLQSQPENHSQNDFRINSYSKASQKLATPDREDNDDDFRVVQSRGSLTNAQPAPDSSDHVIRLNINSHKRVNKKKSKSVITKPSGSNQPIQKSIFSQCGSFSKVPDLEPEAAKRPSVQKMVLLELEQLSEAQIKAMMQMIS